QAGGHARHFFLGGRVDSPGRVVECSHDQVLQHVLVVPKQRRVDRDPLHLVLPGHHDLHQARPRLSLHFHDGELLLQFLHVLLHELRLLHQVAKAAFHISPRYGTGLIDDSTTRASKFSTSSRTKGSCSMAAVACPSFCCFSRSAIAAGELPALSATWMTSLSLVPKCCSRATFNRSWNGPSSSRWWAWAILSSTRAPSRATSSQCCASIRAIPVRPSWSTSSCHDPSAGFFFDSGAAAGGGAFAARCGAARW